MKEILNLLVEKIKQSDNCSIYGHDRYFNIGEFEVCINGSDVTVQKDGKIIYSEKNNMVIPMFLDFTFYGKVFKESERVRRLQEKREALEEEMNKQEEIDSHNEYIAISMNAWINELKGIEIKKTGEFDDIVEDHKRLAEITKEANRIQNKYRKQFSNI